MFAFARSVVLKEKLGNEGLIELDSTLDAVGRQWRNQVFDAAANRFERRLTEEISAVRLSIIRWMVGLLVAQAGVIIGTVFAMMTFLVNALKP